MDDSSKLLRSSRAKMLRNSLIAVALLGIGIGAAVVLSKSSKDKAAPPADGSDLAVAVDAAPPPPPAVDAAGSGMSRQDIEAMSRFGFLTLDSEPKAKLYLNDKFIGETPFARMPLAPGIYKAKAVGANGKTKRFELTIYGAKDANLGAIDWSTK